MKIGVGDSFRVDVMSCLVVSKIAVVYQMLSLPSFLFVGQGSSLSNKQASKTIKKMKGGCAETISVVGLFT